MTDSEKLTALADWYKLRMPGNGDEVQQDLRRIANFIHETSSELHLAKMTVIEDDKLIKNLQAQLSSKEQECDKTNDILIELRAENERLKSMKESWEKTADDRKAQIQLKDRVAGELNLAFVQQDNEINRLRKRCEDLEAGIKAVFNHFTVSVLDDQMGQDLAILLNARKLW